ncbi:pyridoxal phosphate-dependent decarboxylase family protein [Bosea sp. PAMC 26642]|uniref:pyridoxal phosphate-dependent decarboxylase family protein n=1 Tax=Bosea sp. (strain PAMC 26642) TaxID=1792307 RepID=UPI00077017C6|nr:aminotransferase class V-fold PLP-dependent enzyme [Bosea sp. PAMC 26642]AMJ61198.1 pyridoxal-dependent decarboxylase [Bosea sp. PAMC 26642]
MSEIEFDPAALFQDVAGRATSFRRAIGGSPQRPLANYREMTAIFEGPTPEQGAEAEQVIDELARKAEPGLHATTGPRFFGWVIGASHPVGVAADWLTSAWGQNCGNHQAAPAAAAAEAAAAAWLLDILALPDDCSVGFVTGATVANFVCLGAARGEVLRRAGWDVEAAGLFGAPPIHVLIGDDAHTTVFSALQLLGLGHDRVIRVATDEAGRMKVEAFAEAMAGCDGPIIVLLQAGQINTGAFDPFPEIIRIAHARSAWVHIDGAFGLWARACPEVSALATGADLADSWATDGHKWLQTPYDCGYAIVRDSRAHRRAMTASASYLPEVAAGERDPSHFVPELSRRARGFATWAMIRHLGRSGIAAMVARHCALARHMAARLGGEPGIAVLNDVVLNQIIVRFGADETPERGDALTQAVIARVQSDAECFAGGARWRGRWVMRLSVISWPTGIDDADRTVDAIIAAWRACKGG